jgi:hypothetical protein
MNHIENDRLHEFAIEVIDFTEAENIHLDDCVTCWRRLVAEVQLVVFEATESDDTRLLMR